MCLNNAHGPARGKGVAAPSQQLPCPTSILTPSARPCVRLATCSNQPGSGDDCYYCCSRVLLSFSTSYQTTVLLKHSTSHRTLCTLYRSSFVDTWRVFLTINITISQSIDYQSTAFSTLCPLICKSITIARTQDLSPSPSVLCLQPERRLCCCTMLFLPTKAGSWNQATLPPVFSANSYDYYTATGPPQVYSNCYRHPSADALCHCYSR
jgi:hypothetical protein